MLLEGGAACHQVPRAIIQHLCSCVAFATQLFAGAEMTHWLRLAAC